MEWREQKAEIVKAFLFVLALGFVILTPIVIVYDVVTIEVTKRGLFQGRD